MIKQLNEITIACKQMTSIRSEQKNARTTNYKKIFIKQEHEIWMWMSQILSLFQTCKEMHMKCVYCTSYILYSRKIIRSQDLEAYKKRK